MQSHAEFTLIFDTVFSTFSSNDLKLGEFLWAKSKSFINILNNTTPPPINATALSCKVNKKQVIQDAHHEIDMIISVAV